MTTRQRSMPQAASFHPWRTFFIALTLYTLLSIREMSAWTKPVWLGLTFVAIPGLAALALGRGGTIGENIRVALWSVGGAMALYTAFHLMRLHSLFGLRGDFGASINVFFAGLVVCTVYGLGAGVVAAGVRLVRSRLEAAGEDR